MRFVVEFIGRKREEIVKKRQKMIITWTKNINEQSNILWFIDIGGEDNTDY